MFDNLSERLEGAFKSLKGEGKITELNVAESVKEIRRALVAADVNYNIAKEFTNKIKDKALGEKVLTAVQPGQLMVKIVYDELTELMGKEAVKIDLSGKPTVILIAGLQGSGKTTFSGKLARLLKTKEYKNPLLTACDVYRPAAIDQLTTLGEQIGVPVYKEIENKNPVQIALNAIAHAQKQKHDVVIVDTAGRLAVDEAMMTEISEIREAISPNETLFVVDAMTGQDAVNTAKAFNEIINFDGVVLTKLDGDTRGGAALSIRYTVGKPIKYISRGETLETLDVFYPDRMSSRILNMGDVVSLVEKAQAQISKKEADRLQKRISKNQFDFDDFLSQLNHIKKMGNIKSLISMIPGMGKLAKNLDIDDDAFKRIEAIILSMTPHERSHPDGLNASRKRRISAGSGNTLLQVNQFIRQFEEMRKVMHKMSKQQAGGAGMKKPRGSRLGRKKKRR